MSKLNTADVSPLVGKTISSIAQKGPSGLRPFAFIVSFRTGELLTITADELQIAVDGAEEIVEQWDE